MDGSEATAVYVLTPAGELPAGLTDCLGRAGGYSVVSDASELPADAGVVIVYAPCGRPPALPDGRDCVRILLKPPAAPAVAGYDVIIDFEASDFQASQTRASDFQTLRLSGLDSLAVLSQLVRCARLLASARAERFVPATELCGDYYDYIVRPDGAFDIVVADVTGHGVASAMVSVQVRALAHIYSLEGLRPAAILERLNRFVHANFQRRYLMTMFLVRVMPDYRVEYAGAGHNPFIRGRAGEPPQTVASQGIPLGIRVDYEYRQDAFVLAPGERSEQEVVPTPCSSTRGHQADFGHFDIASFPAAGILQRAEVKQQCSEGTRRPAAGTARPRQAVRTAIAKADNPENGRVPGRWGRCLTSSST